MKFGKMASVVAVLVLAQACTHATGGVENTDSSAGKALPHAPRWGNTYSFFAELFDALGDTGNIDKAAERMGIPPGESEVSVSAFMLLKVAYEPGNSVRITSDGCMTPGMLVDTETGQRRGGHVVLPEHSPERLREIGYPIMSADGQRLMVRQIIATGWDCTDYIYIAPPTPPKRQPRPEKPTPGQGGGTRGAQSSAPSHTPAAPATLGTEGLTDFLSGMFTAFRESENHESAAERMGIPSGKSARHFHSNPVAANVQRSRFSTTIHFPDQCIPPDDMVRAAEESGFGHGYLTTGFSHTEGAIRTIHFSVVTQEKRALRIDLRTRDGWNCVDSINLQ